MKRESRTLKAVARWASTLIAAFLCLFTSAAVTPPHPFPASQEVGSASLSPETQQILPEYVEGLFLDMKGDHWRAIDCFRRVRFFKPDEPALNYSMSQAFLHLALPDSARAYGEAAVKLDPENGYYLRYLAGIAHYMRDYERAAELYGQASIAEPDRHDSRYQQGVEYLAAKKPLLALETFRTLLGIEPDNEAALTQVLLIEIGLNRYQEAILTAQHLIRLRENDRTLRLTLSELYGKTDQPQRALQTLHDLIDSDRNDVAAWMVLFDYTIRRGGTPEFSREFSGFLKSEALPEERLHDLIRLFVARSAGNPLYREPAAIVIDALIDRYPRDAELLVLKGVYRMLQDRKKEALDCYAGAVRLDPANVTAWEFLVLAHLDLNEKGKAFRQLSKARAQLPAQHLRWQIIEGHLHLRSGSPARAAALIEKAVASKSAKVDTELLVKAHLDLAVAYDLLGLKKRTREVYGKILRLDAHNAVAMNNLAYMLAEEGIQLPRAFRLASNAVMLDPGNGVYLDTLGWVHFRLGNYEIARQLFEKALATGTEEADIYQHLGQVYRKLGNGTKAKEMFDKAKKVRGR